LNMSGYISSAIKNIILGLLVANKFDEPKMDNSKEPEKIPIDFMC